jgi:hypothetical protein
MRLLPTLLILAAGLAISAAVWAISGGRMMFLFLPLIVLPFVWRRR